MNTLVDDRHIYHTEVPDGRQANDRFAHETSWFEYCTLCRYVCDQLEELV